MTIGNFKPLRVSDIDPAKLIASWLDRPLELHSEQAHLFDLAATLPVVIDTNGKLIMGRDIVRDAIERGTARITALVVEAEE